LTLRGTKNAQEQPPLKHVVSSPVPPKVFAKWVAAKKKLDKTVASLSPGAQEAMAGVTTIMNAKLEALTYAVNCTIRRR
jgi:hypothetical protein